jgi:hypothetical protein
MRAYVFNFWTVIITTFVSLTFPSAGGLMISIGAAQAAALQVFGFPAALVMRRLWRARNYSVPQWGLQLVIMFMGAALLVLTVLKVIV